MSRQNPWNRAFHNNKIVTPSKDPVSDRRQAVLDTLEQRQLLCNVGSHAALGDGQIAYDTVLQAPAGHDNPARIKGLTLGTRTPVSDVPIFHSRPAASVKIFLDFDGDVPNNSPRYDADNNPLYSDAEQGIIQSVWSRVSEYFSPFNVDVTTQDPGNRNGLQTAQARIANDPNVGAVGGAGGVGTFTLNNNSAYIGVGDGGLYWAFGIAVTVAHEVGHLFNLWHQGTLNAQGQPIEEYGSGEPTRRWIMGGNNSDSVRNLWRLGPAIDGPGTGNTTMVYRGEQDDLAVIAGSRNGFGYRADDWTDVRTAANDLTDLGSGALSPFDRDGVIENTSDTDTFAFTSYGQGVTISLTTPAGGMLDATLELRRVNGQLVQSSATSSLGESMTFSNLPRGKYYVEVKSAGNYGDVGQYHLAMQVAHLGVGRTFVVSTSADSGVGSLRQAILDANVVPAGEEPPQIIFNANIVVLPNQDGRLRIQPLSGALPLMTRAMIIDGASQPVPASTLGARVALDGSSITAANTHGLRVSGAGSSILNLGVQRFTGHGVSISGDNNLIAGCYIGIDAAGAVAAGNGGRGISIASTADGNVIGGADPQDMNIIAANGSTQIALDGNNAIVPASYAHNNTVRGNRIGTNASGSAVITTDTAGLELLNGAYSNTIDGNLFAGLAFAGVSFFRSSGSDAGAHDNVVRNNTFGLAANGQTKLGMTREGVYFGSASFNNLVESNTIVGSNLTACVGLPPEGGSGNTLRNNYIGTNNAGTNGLGGSREGIYLAASGDTVSGNIVANNALAGIYVDGGDNNTLTGNWVGVKNLDILGSSFPTSAGNGGVGIALYNGANNNRVGGTTAAERNVVAASGSHGVDIAFSSTGNQILGNYIGTNAPGTLSGSYANGGNGVQINASSSSNVVRGNVISGNAGGVHLGGTSNGNVVAGNFIGTNPSGTAALGNAGSGVIIDAGAANNTIGGSASADRNIISGNGVKGVYLYNLPGSGNAILGNYIGLGSDGITDLGNGQEGVVIAQGALNTRVGGSTTGEGNVISGNAWPAVSIFDSATTGTLVRGNYLGTDATGTVARANDIGVYLANGTTSNIIGGSNPGDRNIISGNLRHGVWLDGANTTGNTVAGNYIGLSASGIAAVGNGLDGIHTENGAKNNTIGGSAAAAGNVVSGNGANGIQLRGPGSTLVVDTSNVRFNRVGTNAPGTAALGNGGVGILIYEMSQVQVLDNLVSGNASHGIHVFGGNTYNTVVQRNLVGANAAGTARLGNNQTGIYLENSAIQIQVLDNTVVANGNGGILAGGQGSHVVRGNFIGTNAAGATNLGNTGYGIRSATSATGNNIGRDATPGNNIIAYNAGAGVVIDLLQINPTAHTVRGNSIFSNGGLGIDLGGNGVTQNDPGDVDTGPNGLQNFPLLRNAVNGSGTQTIMTGVLNTTPGLYMLDFYSDSAPDASGYGEGRTLLLSTDVTVNSGGTLNLSIPLPFVVSGQWITATATRKDAQATSEFSQAVMVSASADTAAPSITSSAFAFDRSPHSVRFTFSESVAASLQASDVTVASLPSGGNVPVQSMSYDPATNVATFTFAGILPDGNYRATLNVSGVNDPAGNVLLAANNVLNFFVLSGDANRDRVVNFDDLLVLAQNYGQSGRTFSQGDFNFDGTVDFADLLLLAQQYESSVLVMGHGDLPKLRHRTDAADVGL